MLYKEADTPQRPQLLKPNSRLALFTMGNIRFYLSSPQWHAVSIHAAMFLSKVFPSKKCWDNAQVLILKELIFLCQRSRHACMAIQLTRGACADAGMHASLEAGVKKMGIETFCLPFWQKNKRGIQYSGISKQTKQTIFFLFVTFAGSKFPIHPSLLLTSC